VTWHPMQKLIEEREKGFKQQVLLAGCRPIVYVLASVASNGLAVLPCIFIVLFVGLCFGVMSFGVMMSFVLAGILFAFAAAAFNYWISLHFEKATTATTVLSIVTIWLTSIPLMLSVVFSVLFVASSFSYFIRCRVCVTFGPVPF